MRALPAILCLAVLAVASACGGASGGAGGAASCAAVVELDGHAYWGHGSLRRTPPTTGRSLPAVLPACDDTGGQDAADRDEAVEVEELDGVEPSVAVLFHEAIYVRDGEELPASADAWFRAPGCDNPGDFGLTADWLGVRSAKRVRFDGDVRLPYRLEVRVTEGPAAYVGTKVTLRAPLATGPTLSPEDVKTSLREGGQVVATVRCDGAAFELVEVRALPPA